MSDETSDCEYGTAGQNYKTLADSQRRARQSGRNPKVYTLHRREEESSSCCSLLCLICLIGLLAAGILTVPEAPFTGQRPRRVANQFFKEQAGHEIGEVFASESGAEPGGWVYRGVRSGMKIVTKMGFNFVDIVNDPNFRSWNFGCFRVVHFALPDKGAVCFLGACRSWTLCSEESAVAKTRKASAAARKAAKKAFEDP